MAAAQRAASNASRSRRGALDELAEARALMLPSQLPLLDALEAKLKDE